MHLNLDDAWSVQDLPTLELRRWGPVLRYCAPERAVERFAGEVFTELRRRGDPRFLLLGSGDFHYLTALWLRRLEHPVTLISFDNHPDWDRRPPRWACGGWINRALELPTVERAAVWGCGNFELRWPGRLFAHHAALRGGRLRVFPWAERYSAADAARWSAMTRGEWRGRFEDFVRSLHGQNTYVTVDLDCLQTAITNWENGLFTAEDVAWALGQLHAHTRVVGGDVCGAWSPPRYARLGQRLAGGWDHPRRTPCDPADAQATNGAILRTLWPALGGPS